MDFEFSVDQESLRQTVRRFLSTEAPLRPYVRAQLDDPAGTTEKVWRGLAEIGATGLLVPEHHGGAGMGMVDIGVVLEEMGRLSHPGPFLSSAVGAVSLVCAAGSEADQSRLLPELAGGTMVAVPALLELGARSDWLRIAVRAEQAGEPWLLTGVKCPVHDAMAADFYIVSAATADGPALFTVDRSADGVSAEALSSVDGTRKVGRLTLEAAPAQRLGTGVVAADAALGGAVDRILVGLVTDGVGAAEAALEMAVDYAKQRMQFDKPIGSFQAVQHLCAEMLQSVELARAGAYYALWAADAAPPTERHRAALMAKAYASDALFRVGASAIQVFGGIGFTWEHDIHLYYKRLLTLQEAFGGTSEHLEALAAQVL